MWRKIYNKKKKKISQILRWVKSFCNILVMWDTIQVGSIYFYWGCEIDEPHWIVRCWVHLILSEYNSPDLAIYAWSTASEYMVLVLPDLTWLSQFLRTLVKFLEPPGYCTVINYAFTFYGCFHSIMIQFEPMKHHFPNETILHIHLCNF